MGTCSQVSRRESQFLFIFLLLPSLFWWIYDYDSTGSYRSRQTCVSRTEGHTPRSHHVPHYGQIEHCVHHTGSVATRRASAAPVPRRGRADPRSRRRFTARGGVRGGGGRTGRRAPGILSLHGRGGGIRVHDPERKGGTKRYFAEGTASTSTTSTTTIPRLRG